MYVVRLWEGKVNRLEFRKLVFCALSVKEWPSLIVSLTKQPIISLLPNFILLCQPHLISVRVRGERDYKWRTCPNVIAGDRRLYITHKRISQIERERGNTFYFIQDQTLNAALRCWNGNYFCLRYSYCFIKKKKMFFKS